MTGTLFQSVVGVDITTNNHPRVAGSVGQGRYRHSSIGGSNSIPLG